MRKRVGIETSQSVEVFKYDDGKQRTLIRNLAGPFTELQYPIAPCTDKSVDVYVPDTYTGVITEYAYGASTPKKTLDDRGNAPTGCSVDPTNGDLAVVNYSHASVSIYKQAMGEPKIHRSLHAIPKFTDEGGIRVFPVDGNVYGLVIVQKPR